MSGQLVARSRLAKNSRLKIFQIRQCNVLCELCASCDNRIGRPECGVLIGRAADQGVKPVRARAACASGAHYNTCRLKYPKIFDTGA